MFLAFTRPRVWYFSMKLLLLESDWRRVTFCWIWGEDFSADRVIKEVVIFSSTYERAGLFKFCSMNSKSFSSSTYPSSFYRGDDLTFTFGVTTSRGDPIILFRATKSRVLCLPLSSSACTMDIRYSSLMSLISWSLFYLSLMVGIKLFLALGLNGISFNTLADALETLSDLDLAEAAMKASPLSCPTLGIYSLLLISWSLW